MTTATATNVTVDQRFQHYARFMSLPYGPRRTAAHLAWSIESFANCYREDAVALAVSVISADASDWDAALDAFIAATGEYGDNYWNTPASMKAMKVA
jgi:hypothetical protein